MKNKILKPFDLQEALTGKAVMLRNGDKAYVRHHETELGARKSNKLLGYLAGGAFLSWCENGVYFDTGVDSDGDIIGMYPETCIINGFEVPAPETKEPECGDGYYLASTTNIALFSSEIWTEAYCERLWLERGLVFLNKEDAIANTKAMLGIDPRSKVEKS